MSRLLPLLVAVALAAVGAAPAAAPAQDAPTREAPRADGRAGTAQDDRPPAIEAPSAIVVEASTGDVAYAKNPAQPRRIASTTKLMTALVTLESVALDDVLTVVPYAADPVESVGGLRAGERMTVRDLLRSLLLASANDAAVTLATGVSGSVPRFVEEMNARARRLGLRDTHFANPIGLDQEGNRSSARDLVRLAIHLRENAFFRRTVDLPRATLTSGDRRRTVVNRNLLVRRVPEVDGVKTGHTSQAGYVLVGSATRAGVTVVSAVLGASSEQARDAQTLALLRYGLRQYRRRTVVRAGQTLARADLAYRDEQVRLIAGRTISRVLRRGQDAQVRVVGAPRELDGPLTAGATVGTVEVRVGGRVVARTPLVTATAVEKAGLSTRVGHVLGQASTHLLVSVVVACTVLLVLLRRRVVGRMGSRA
jgi:D-alanyl-D-alanine carboxypeptidase (penicillin-binding protein 5/6)